MIRSARTTCAPVASFLALAATLVLATSAAALPARPADAAAPGAHRYKLVLLLAGERPHISKALGDSMQAGHLANIGAMFRSGALDAAGPFGDSSPLIGLFVFHAEDADLASLLAPDPILGAGRLVAKPYTWIAREGLGEAYRKRGTIEPGRDSMVVFSFVLLKRGPRAAASDSRGLDAPTGLLGRRHGEDGPRMSGPIEGGGELRGIALFDADSSRTAALVARDPAVRSGRLVAEIHPWWTAYGVVPGP